MRALSLCTCCRQYPGAATGRRLRSSHPAVSAFPEIAVGSACTSSFSRLARRLLALRPAHSRRHLYVTCYTEGFSHFVTSMTAPVASGWSVRRVGLAPTGKRRLLTAHANSGHSPTACQTSRVGPKRNLRSCRNETSASLAERRTRIRLIAAWEGRDELPLLRHCTIFRQHLATLRKDIGDGGMNAPRNPTVYAAFLICSLAMGSAFFLILELDRPFEGLLRISSRPVTSAVANILPEGR